MDNNKKTEPDIRFATAGGGKIAQSIADEKDFSKDTTEESVPKLRFEGFEGEWKKKIFSNICKRVSASAIAGELPGIEYDDIVSGDGCLNKDFYNKKCRKQGKLFGVGDVLFGKLRPYLRNIIKADFEGVAIGDFWVLHPIDTESDFVYMLVNSDAFMRIANISSGSKMPRADWELVSSSNFSIPSLPEQQKIATFFTSLDKQIKAAEKGIASLKQVKAACLQSMFPQEGETVPKVRFEGFEGEWEKLKADTVFKTVNERNRPDLPVLSATQDKGMVTREAIGYNIFHDSSNETTYKHIRPGQFVIHLRSFQGGFAHSSLEGICSPAYTILQFKNKDCYDDLYWSYVLTSKEFIRKLELITYGIRDGRSISFQEFRDMYFFVPYFPEQQKIATFFTALDKKIDLQGQRLEKLRQIKKACLDKMFV